jgi:hypothetical protein
MGMLDGKVALITGRSRAGARARGHAALKGTTFKGPQVIADTALYLNSSLAAKVTGVTIPVDAGHLILTPNNLSPTRSAESMRGGTLAHTTTSRTRSQLAGMITEVLACQGAPLFPPGPEFP